IKFVSDAIISLSFENVLGQNVRALRVIKDRDHPVEQPLHYVTLKDQLRIFDPFYMLSRPSLGRFTSMSRPPSTEADSIKYLGNRVLIELDMSVEDVRGSLLRKMFIADYIKMGYKVNYLLGPNESKETFLEDIKAIIENTSRLNILIPAHKDYGYKADKIPRLQKTYEENVVNVINLLADEDFAIKDPVEYELYVRGSVNRDRMFNRTAFIFGYSNQEALKIEQKYANIFWRLTVTDGFFFWRSFRPLGPLYFVDISSEKGKVDFIRVV
ncbi:MAG: hypothetical protein ACP5FU_06450, partial [Nitrososphaeria archaeon]